MKSTYILLCIALSYIFLSLFSCQLTRREKQQRFNKRHWKRLAKARISARRVFGKDTLPIFQQVVFTEADTPTFYACHYSKKGKKNGIEIIHRGQDTIVNQYKKGVKITKSKLLKRVEKFGLNHFKIKNGDTIRLYQWFEIEKELGKILTYKIAYYRKGKLHGIKLEYDEIDKSYRLNNVNYSYNIERYRYGQKHGVSGGIYYKALYRFGRLIWGRKIMPFPSF